ncbi:MAG: hypothetical protein L0287_10155, partial [Anaerolineae bacterium]|nr:hypothetical protein [Anaerolineae bacterium]
GDYLFRGGPGPVCRATADMNDNGIINLDDYNYLVNYFSGGPAPFPPFPFCGTDLSGPPCTLSCCTPTECNDGIDNDGDGLIDFPADCGCTDASDTTEAPNPTRECNNGIDNDGDGFTDLADCGCANACDSSEAPDPLTECNDGIDNDGDGFIDDADCGCNLNCNKEFPPDQCHDGIDNDGDGLVDLADTNCVDTCDFDECSLFPCSTCCFKPGDVNGDGKWTISDIVGLVNIVFKGATKPCPPCRADANGSGGNPNLSDIVKMVGKVFKGASDPPPIGVCCLN